MSLVGLVVVLMVFGVLLWLLNTQIPMDANIKKIINVVVLIVVVLWILQVFGLLESINAVHVGRVSSLSSYSECV